MTYSLMRHFKLKLSTLRNGLNMKKLCTNSRFHKPRKVLGIETSCDDTGAAVVDEEGNILGNSLHSQTLVSVA